MLSELKSINSIHVYDTDTNFILIRLNDKRVTETGTFIINGAERVIVSQLVRSPGAYYGENIDHNGNKS